MKIFGEIVLLLSILLLANAARIPLCSNDEIYSECERCPLMCENLLSDDICGTECMKGCFCKEGLARNRTGYCVDVFTCPLEYKQECEGENEEFKECGSRCSTTCENGVEIEICTKGCYPGCMCKEGFVRNSAGVCAALAECGVSGVSQPDTECGENQVQTECMTCPETCDNRETKSDCLLECRSGCACAPGYILASNITNECINISKCQYKHKHKHGHRHNHQHERNHHSHQHGRNHSHQHERNHEHQHERNHEHQHEHNHEHQHEHGQDSHEHQHENQHGNQHENQHENHHGNQHEGHEHGSSHGSHPRRHNSHSHTQSQGNSNSPDDSHSNKESNHRRHDKHDRS